MQSTLRLALEFAAAAAALVFAVDVLLSLVFQPPPVPEYRAAFLLIHGIFHAAVLILSAIGASVGYALIRGRLPSTRLNIGLALVYGFFTLLAGPGSFILGGRVGAVAWLLMGSMAFTLGVALLRKPWRRTSSI